MQYYSESGDVLHMVMFILREVWLLLKFLGCFSVLCLVTYNALAIYGAVHTYMYVHFGYKTPQFKMINGTNPSKTDTLKGGAVRRW